MSWWVGVCGGGSRTLRSSTCGAGVSSHRHSLLVLLHILEIFERLLQIPAVDSLCGFACVFEADAEIGAAGARRFGGFDGCASVADLVGGV